MDKNEVTLVAKALKQCPFPALIHDTLMVRLGSATEWEEDGVTLLTES